MNPSESLTYELYHNGEQFWVTSISQSGARLIEIPKTPLERLPEHLRDRFADILKGVDEASY